MIKTIAFDFGGTLFSTARMGEFTQNMVDAFIDRVVESMNCSREKSELIFAKYVEAWKSRQSRGGSGP